MVKPYSGLSCYVSVLAAERSVHVVTVRQTRDVEWPILNVLAHDDRREFLRSCRRRRFGPNEVIFHEGDPGDTLHLIDRGHVAVRVTTPLGDVATLRVLAPGEFFGELAVVSPAPRNATAIAKDRVETLSVHRDQVEELRLKHPRVDRVLVEALSAEVRRLAFHLVDALYVPVERRVWRRLTELARTFSSDGEGAIVPLTQEDLAQVVGTTRPTVNRLLREGESAGFLRITRGQVEIVDAGALARRAW
jgi:CRP/FNR family cyclic AMP-dependent transcriptional regulator